MSAAIFDGHPADGTTAGLAEAPFNKQVQKVVILESGIKMLVQIICRAPKTSSIDAVLIPVAHAQERDFMVEKCDTAHGSELRQEGSADDLHPSWTAEGVALTRLLS